ncbi:MULTISPECIES: hypothetical protein [unclassified Beijerinckia]|uniref:hypothetical protein n=1 Tax=unclassified Beijerinckia TaxID=2638183 RepID=UPI000894BE62|nr:MULTISPECIES: hypothetical protein [unclassified Beijerinckia]MDH7796473.1 hypothetical protein [Beijerinckia sp. GAS462]SEC46647.1 hypothetical protein SAMN05443249_2757 [Beijerinckia sp. 28-YEA-48]
MSDILTRLEAWANPDGEPFERDAYEAAQALRELKKRYEHLVCYSQRADPTHRHIKRGTEYRVVGVSKLQTSQPIEEGTEIVHYVGVDKQSWSRPASEFNDGRFEILVDRYLPETM